MAITLPYRFDTSNVWRIILTGAFGLNAVLVAGIVYTLLVRREPGISLGLALCELIVLGFTRVFVRFQDGSAGTLTSDRVEIAPNVLLGIPLPGPRGTYALDRFSAVRVEFRSGAVSASANAAGPHEVVWLAGRPDTPDIALARTEDGAGGGVGRELGALLGLPVEEVGKPRVIRLSIAAREGTCQSKGNWWRPCGSRRRSTCQGLFDRLIKIRHIAHSALRCRGPLASPDRPYLDKGAEGKV